MQGLTLWNRIHFSTALGLARFALCIVYGGGWVVLWCVLKVATGSMGSGASGEVQT